MNGFNPTSEYLQNLSASLCGNVKIKLVKELILTGTLVLVLAGCSSAQKGDKKLKSADVPATVQGAFKEQYPSITDIDWEKEGDNYEAEFENDKIETSVVINTTGEILETETEMAPSALPESVLSYLETNYKGKKIKEAGKIVLSDGTINYEVEMNNKDLIFDSNGKFIKTVAD